MTNTRNFKRHTSDQNPTSDAYMRLDVDVTKLKKEETHDGNVMISLESKA